MKGAGEDELSGCAGDTRQKKFENVAQKIEDLLNKMLGDKICIKFVVKLKRINITSVSDGGRLTQDEVTDIVNSINDTDCVDIIISNGGPVKTKKGPAYGISSPTGKRPEDKQTKNDDPLLGDMVIPENTLRTRKAGNMFCPGEKDLIGTERGRQTVPAHEMGHILGQEDESKGENLMNPNNPSTDLTQRQKMKFKENAKLICERQGE